MQSKKVEIKGTKDATVFPDGVRWEEIIKNLKQKKNQEFLNRIDPSTYKLILDENSHSVVINSLLKTLKKTDPKNATKEYAESLAKVMKKVTRMILKRS